MRLRLFENTVLRKKFGHHSDEITGKWRKIHNGKHYDLYSSRIIRLIKSRRKTWAGHVARRGREKNAYRVLLVYIKI
jgi:hypothetical protein